ncbi:cystatin-A5-like [Betta splendens]|uniref:Cystatin-B n=1 Tax=Betta splendens TaxID=158456 RepID=A0A6P7M9N4_BETSP|nr:cystatin-A5-like [Betta splendens]
MTAQYSTRRIIHFTSTNLETMETCVGGYTGTSDADAQTQRLVDLVKCQLEEKTNKTYEELQAIEYRSQFVCGTNYLIKVRAGLCSYIHIIVFEALPVYGGEVKLMEVKENHTRDHPLIPF